MGTNSNKKLQKLLQLIRKWSALTSSAGLASKKTIYQISQISTGVPKDFKKVYSNKLQELLAIRDRYFHSQTNVRSN